MTQREALDTIHSELKRGNMYGRICHYRPDHPDSPNREYFSPTLYPIFKPRGLAFIGWTHYGSSANKPTKKALEWIIRTIFNTTPAEFLQTYSTRSGYMIGE